eukprot:1231016-Rhodomonas_salina.1
MESADFVPGLSPSAARSDSFRSAKASGASAFSDLSRGLDECELEENKNPENPGPSLSSDPKAAEEQVSSATKASRDELYTQTSFLRDAISSMESITARAELLGRLGQIGESVPADSAS